MNILIDIATLNDVASTFYLILLLLLLVFWRQNPDIESIIWWCGFPLFRLVNSVIGSDSVTYEFEFIVYIGNYSILLSDTLLMIGCLKFTNKNIPWKIIGTYLGIFLVVCIYQHSLNIGLQNRTKALVIFDLIPIIASIIALSRLTNVEYVVEKIYTISWLVFGIFIFIFWILIDFDFGNPAYGSYVITSLALAYVSHIMIALGLIILTIAERRNKLLADIEVNKALENNLEEILEEAKAANEEKNQFLANMSHELRTPLNTIIGYAESLRLGFYGELNKKQKEYVENITSGGELLLKLIMDLLNLSDVEEGKVDIVVEEVNITRLFEKTLPLLKEIVGKESNRLKIINSIRDGQESTSATIDLIRTKQILINFMSNAVKYSERETPISIELKDLDDQYYRISVEDKGRGISENQKMNIFKPFNRAGIDNSQVEGIGVGLSIAKSLIEEMQGRINFESTEGEGSIFWIDIPKSKQRRLPIG